VCAIRAFPVHMMIWEFMIFQLLLPFQPQLPPQMVEIPRSTFNFDFDYERRILAEAEKENPNWSKFVVERQAPPPVPQQQASYIAPTSVFHISITIR
jgi:hypothetical protein